MSSNASRSGLEAAFLDNREKLIRFLRARGAGDAAEDIVQELWLKVSASKSGPVASPLSYLFRMADLAMIDRFRSMRQAEKRDRAWTEINAAGADDGLAEPSPERRIIAAQEASRVMGALARLGARAETVFRRHRIDGVAQRQIAAELGISLSTVESDLRSAYRALAELKERGDEV